MEGRFPRAVPAEALQPWEGVGLPFPQKARQSLKHLLKSPHSQVFQDPWPHRGCVLTWVCPDVGVSLHWCDLTVGVSALWVCPDRGCVITWVCPHRGCVRTLETEGKDHVLLRARSPGVPCGPLHLGLHRHGVAFALGPGLDLRPEGKRRMWLLRTKTN